MNLERPYSDGLASRPPAGEVLSLGDALFDFGKRSATRGTQPVHLTPVEFKLLACLAKSLGLVVTHRQLLTEVWGPSHAKDTHYRENLLASDGGSVIASRTLAMGCGTPG